VVSDRRIAAVPEMLRLVASPDPAVRGVAYEALGNVVDLGNLNVLIEQAVKPRDPGDAEAARKAVKQAAIRMADRDACADKLAAAVATAPADVKIMLLDILGEVGGTRALAAVAAAGKSKDKALEDAATRLLGKWMTADAAPVLLELATPSTGCSFQTRALRGYLRIARQFALPDLERAEMCRRALAVATARSIRRRSSTSSPAIRRRLGWRWPGKRPRSRASPKRRRPRSRRSRRSCPT
jgi:hypothetical protein